MGNRTVSRKQVGFMENIVTVTWINLQVSDILDIIEYIPITDSDIHMILNI